MNARQAEEYLLGLELFGMRFGLDRMHRLMTVLGLPQRRFASIHVVGSNGKSSTVRFVAALLERHGLRTGSYTSPHLGSFRERVEVGEEPVPEEDFAAAVARAAQAAEMVNRTEAPDDRVTQFEALTAAAYSELARRGVEVAVIEAGLGGRYDATNVLPSKVQVLTSVGLEHTRWLGPTIEDIAEEKLAVVRDHSTLAIRDGLAPAARAAAARTARRTHSRLVRAEAELGVELRAPGRFQRGNFALAAAAAEAFLERPLERASVERAARETRIPGRLDVVSDEPLTVLDGAHNPEGALALAELARRGARRAPPARGRDRRARRQGRRGDARQPAAAARPRGVHAPGQPALALARHAHEPRAAAGRAAGRDGARAACRAAPSTRAGGPGGQRPRDRLDLPDRRPRARRHGRPRVDAVGRRWDSSSVDVLAPALARDAPH